MFRRWAVVNLLARLPMTMNLLALVLVGEAVTGSLANGASLAGIATVSAGLAAQWRGRMLDRVELREGLRRHLGLSALAVLALLGAAAGWVQSFTLLAILAFMAPSLTLAVMGLLDEDPEMLELAGWAGGATGFGMLVLGILIGGFVFRRRAPELLGLLMRT